MVKYTGINHLAMATRDMDTTIRFWRDLLGMRLVAGLGRPGYRHGGTRDFSFVYSYYRWLVLVRLRTFERRRTCQTFFLPHTLSAI
jgi:catechol 2,3-dioxygenase-like lactoylglutathione lyase family enzyme